VADHAPGTASREFRPGSDTAPAVREEIAASWQRSVLHGLRPDRIEASYDPDLDLGGRFARAAGPVADQLSDDLAGSGVALLLADEQARVIDRRVSDLTFRVRLDQIMLAPGFRHSEENAGTNAIGTALRQASPVAVAGAEHFADVLRELACSAAPITDPRTGAVLGAVGLTCRAETANPLMLPLVKRARREIEERLLAGTADDGALLAHFRQARRRARGPLVSVNERTLYANASADRLLRPADRALLWGWAAGALASGENVVADLSLTSGLAVTARVRAVHDGGVLAGVLVRFDQAAPADRAAPADQAAPADRAAPADQAAPADRAAPADQRGEPPRPGRDRSAYGWDSLTDTERGVAAIVAEGATNRQAAARLYLSQHTIDFHLRQIFRKLEITSRAQLTRLVVEHAHPARGPGPSA